MTETSPESPGFRCAALCPGIGSHAGLAIGASQAGGVGVLDLELGDPEASGRLRRHLQSMLARIPRQATFGVRCRAADLEQAGALLGLLDGRDHVLILHADTPARLAAAGATHRRPGCLGLWVEVSDLKGVAAIASPASGVDAIVACGHECGGTVSAISSFLLAQKLLDGDFLPVLVRGVAGVRGAAACRAAGAAGVVLDHQTLLLPESPLPMPWRRLIESAQGQDYQMLGSAGLAPVTVLAHPAFSTLGELQRASRALELEGPEAQQAFDGTVERLVRLGPPSSTLWPLGQTASWAAWTRDRYSSIGHLVSAVLEGSLQQVRSAARCRPLAPDSSLARRHGTRFPIVQGPMSRVSDRPLFARAVADNGALPMVALALSQEAETRAVLEETAALLGSSPWGVGILGFVTPEIMEVQLREIQRVKPPFALIAGGRPGQALALEREGIATYLHVPVPSLLASFLDQGARRFIFEGRECGGHVGPLSSFILWEQAVETLLSRLPKGEKASLLFAGGIHDARSAAMVAALAAPLAEQGVEIGVLMGTAYLFTHEAVQTGAIAAAFQDVARACRRTVTLESAVGQANRCADTPFARAFYEEKRRLLQQGASSERVHQELDRLLLGRLRQASRGVRRDERGDVVPLEREQQLRDGMYMLGEVATMRSSSLGMEELHLQVSQASTRLLEACSPDLRGPARRKPAPCDVAIVGLALHVPGAQDKDAFWTRLLGCRPALGEVPASRWDWRLYFDADKSARDRSYSRWGGWVDDFVFDPLSFGLPPNRWNSINSSQAISLELARQALQDAGYGQRAFPRKRTATVIASGDSGMFGGALLARSNLAMLAGELPPSLLDRLPEWTEDSFPGVLASLCSGRVANRLDLGGSNFIVDAACASALTAVDMGCHELVSGRADCAIVGGVDIGQTPFDFIGFSKVQALSPTGLVRPFDRRADGIVISEGAAFMVLKRLADAQRDGDRVYAVIRAVGTSSDGRSMGLTAPCSAGQGQALQSAWELSGSSPAELELYEAHATGTALGDSTELETIVSLLTRHGAQPAQCAIGSVKSLVGHTKRAAGLVSLAKTALALYHGVLPPHHGTEEPLEALTAAGAPVCLHLQPQPWFRRPGKVRRAAVSAFGFGGTNAHVVLEEARGPRDAAPGAMAWPVELIMLEEQPGYPMLARVQALRRSLEGAEVRLRDLAYSLAADLWPTPAPGMAAALVVDSVQALEESLRLLQQYLEGSAAPLPPHVMLEQRRGARVGKLAFLFPGQGSQYPSPARELVLYFPELREALQQAEDRLEGCFAAPLIRRAYPPAPLRPEQQAEQRAGLRDTHLAQPLLGALACGSYSLMRRLGFAPDCLAGHSYGELAALCAAGVMSEDDLLALSEARGRLMANLAGPDAGAMAAVSAQRWQVEEFLLAGGPVVVANHNSPDQTVIAGPSQEVEEVMRRLREHGLRALSLTVSGGFHSPVMAPAQSELVKTIRSLGLASPRLPVYSNLNGRPYPVDPRLVLEQLQDHLLSSVEFVAQVQSMASDGARTFVEMAPGSVLSGLVREILPEPDILVAGMDRRGTGLAGFLSMLGRLRCCGVPYAPTALFDGREVRLLDPLALPRRKPPAATSWIVNSGYIRPASDPAPRLGKLPLLTSQTASAAEPLREPSHSSPPARQESARAEGLEAGGTERATPGAPTGPAPPREMPSKRSSGASPVSPAATTDPMQHQSSAVPHRANGSTPSDPGLHFAAPDGEAPGLHDARVLQAYQAYQATMQQFLRTQEQVMADFLGALSGGGGSTAGAANHVPAASALLSGSAEPGGPGRGPTPGRSEANGIRGAQPCDPSQRLPGSGENGSRSGQVAASAFCGREAPAPAAPAVSAGQDAQALPAAPQPDDGPGLPCDRPTIERELVRIVARRTGYPPEMLELHSDLEGHLGIDSIKRLEIVEDLLSLLASSRAAELRDEAEKLIRQRTLAELAQSLARLLSSPESSPQPAPASPARPAPRFLMQPAPADPPRGRPEPGVYLLVGGPCEVARLLAAKLELAGCTSILLDQDSLKQRSSELTSRPDVAGVISLSGLQAESLPQDLEELHRQSEGQLKTLYRVLRACGPGRLARACLLVASRAGGSFGRQGGGGGSLLSAGALGFCRSLATEWRQARCVAVDFEEGMEAEPMAAALLQELLSEDAEVAYRGGCRQVYRPLAADLVRPERPGLEPDSDWVLLATGGARGITARLALSLARPGMRVALAGRTPRVQEDAALQPLQEDSQLRSHFIATAGRDSVSPLEIERRVAAVLRGREVARNLRAFQELGCRVSYHALDAAQPGQLAGLIQQLQREEGRLDAVLHGAGVIEDRLLQDKTEDSFDRVFRTKVDSLLQLQQALPAEGLRLLMLLSSVAGRFGNRGQSDYAAANEVLNRWAWELSRRLPETRVLSVNWGPWAGAGMAGAGHQKAFLARGIEPIPEEQGIAFLRAELAAGAPGDVEVVAGAGDWEAILRATAARSAERLRK
jgi:acyl transferase domain-containing protein/NAD(P)H-dependent flavin oxidoreductase YrpB (nitropropane dioxygenase family)/NAD(P)-dependent dehydrogenase (short-subunit alcohol dehydrogenase family)